MKNLDYKILARHFSGETSWSEELSIKKWRSSDPEAEVIYQQLKTQWLQNFDLNPAAETEKISLIIEQALESKHKKTTQYWAVAASVVILIGFALFFWPKADQKDQDWQQKVTANGQKSTITLSDGSKVFLNYDSELYFPEEFTGDFRKVKLKGEAFFEVQPLKKPFIVEVDSLMVTVLGTSFNINAYEINSDLQVSVASGKVKVNNQQVTVMLLPNEVATYHRNTREMIKSSADVRHTIAWKDGWLTFDDTPLSEVVDKLSKWYGVQVKLASSELEMCLFTGKFKNETLKNVLDNICFTSKLKYRIEDNQFILDGKACNN